MPALRRGVSPRQATLAARLRPAPSCSYRFLTGRMRAAIPRHGQTIRVLPSGSQSADRTLSRPRGGRHWAEHIGAQKPMPHPNGEHNDAGKPAALDKTFHGARPSDRARELTRGSK
jgi:hypothetical protein